MSVVCATRRSLVAAALLLPLAGPAWADGKGDSGFGSTAITSSVDLVQALLNDLESIRETGLPWIVRHAQTRDQRARFRTLVRRIQDENDLLPYTGPTVPPEDFIDFLIRFYNVGLDPREVGGVQGQKQLLLDLTPEIFPVAEFYRRETPWLDLDFSDRNHPDWLEYYVFYTKFGEELYHQATKALLELRVLLELVVEAGPPGTILHSQLMTAIRSMGSDYGRAALPASGPDDDRVIYVSPRLGPAALVRDNRKPPEDLDLPAAGLDEARALDAQVTTTPRTANAGELGFDGLQFAPALTIDVNAYGPLAKDPPADADPDDDAADLFGDFFPFGPGGSTKDCWLTPEECEIVAAVERAVEIEGVSSAAPRSPASVPAETGPIGVITFRLTGSSY